MVMIGSALPMLKEKFGMSEIEAGGLFSILPIGLLIGSVTFGPIADKYGYRWVLSLAALFLSLGFFGIAHAASVNLLRICILFFGIGGGVINGASSALVSDLSEAKNKILNLNWLGAFFGLGAFCMPFALSVIDKSHYSTVIDIASVLSLLVAVLFAIISYPVMVQKDKISFRLVPIFLKNKLFMAICFFLFFQSAFEALVNNWSVSYFINSNNFTQENALLALSFSVLGMIVMRVLTGSVLKKMQHYHLITMALVMLSLGFVALITSSNFVVNSVGMFLLGAGLAPGFPVLLGLAGEMFKEVSATSFSFAMLIALIGNTIINYSTGLLTQRFGIQVYPYVILGEIVFMAFIFLLIRRFEINNKQK